MIENASHAAKYDLPAFPDPAHQRGSPHLRRHEQLSVEEFSSVFPRGTTSEKVVAKFTKLDTNGDNALTRSEWNPGGR
jgi:hypothetical protein